MRYVLTLGTGYVKLGGIIRYKFDLPAGSHSFPDGAVPIEATRADLAEVVVIPEEIIPTPTIMKDLEIVIQKAREVGWLPPKEVIP